MAGHATGKNLFSFQDVGNGGVRPGNDILQIDPVPACLVEYMQMFDQIKAHSAAPRTLHSPWRSPVRYEFRYQSGAAKQTSRIRALSPFGGFANDTRCRTASSNWPKLSALYSWSSADCAVCLKNLFTERDCIRRAGDNCPSDAGHKAPKTPGACFFLSLPSPSYLLNYALFFNIQFVFRDQLCAGRQYDKHANSHIIISFSITGDPSGIQRHSYLFSFFGGYGL